MKRNYHLIFCLFVCLLTSYATHAKQVNEKEVLKVLEKVLKKENKASYKLKKLTPLGFNSDTLIYVAELNKEGFIIISADFVAPPVLGKCFRGSFNLDSLPGGLIYLIDKYQKEIDYLRTNNIEATEKVKYKWKEYLADDDLKSVTAVTTVSPLLSTTWNQGDTSNYQSSSYNRFCPDGCLAGCTAVAMAQILNFWNDAVAQTGSNTNEGATINFSEENYCWDNMSPSSSDSYNSKLIYHAGMSCNMDYCVLFGNGQSLAYVDDALDGFVNYWGMDPSAEKKWRIWHLQTWEQDLKDELDNGRPILYAGGNIGLSHHTWVIDGYNSSDEFHCNWGFKYTYPGDYSLGNFNPRSYNFNEFEHAIFSLYPGVDFFSELIGPNVLTSSADEFRVNNFFDCKGTSWSFSANIASVYGGYEWIAVRAIGSGTGWIQATITVDGSTYTTPKKYITCNP